MEKQAPLDALRQLRDDVEREIKKSRSTEKKGTSALTAVLMSDRTYEVLKAVACLWFDSNNSLHNVFLTKEYGVGFTIVSVLQCDNYRGYIAINNNLAFGKVVLRRHYLRSTRV